MLSAKQADPAGSVGSGIDGGFAENVLFGLMQDSLSAAPDGRQECSI